MTALIGKYFLGFQDGFPIEGVVEAGINDGHYLVRINWRGREPEPEHFAVAAVADMVGGNGIEEEPPSWAFFDTDEQRVRFQAFKAAHHIVPLRKPD
jgi:hypothetical protein